MYRQTKFLASVFIFICILVIFPLTGETSDSAENSSAVGGIFRLKHPTFTQLIGYDIPSIKTQDFNNDGISDVAVVLPSDDKLVIQLGDGEGRLGPPNYIMTGDNPTDLSIGDVNQDGELDILTSNTIPQQVNIFLGDGLGNFTFNSAFSAGGSAYLLTVGKFNQDEFLDVAVGNSNNIKVFFGDGTTTFTQSVQTSVPFSPQRMAQADFDRDGKTDLLVYCFSGDGKSVRVLKGIGDGTFSTPFTYDIEINGFAVGDFNNDTFQDFVINDYRQNSMKTYFGDGNGNFSAPAAAAVGYFWSIVAGDFNQDGNLDLSSDNGSVLLGNGAGGFNVFALSGVNGSRGAVVSDFNSDGMPDVAAIAGTRNPSDSTVVILNDGTGKPVSGASVDYYGSRTFEIESADVNLDGRFDLISCDAAASKIYVHTQDANGVFTSTTGFTGLPAGGFGNQGPFSMTLGDFNEDNKVDIAAPLYSHNQMAIFIGSGTGAFTRSSVNFASGASQPWSVQTGDFNNDTHQDLVSLNYGSLNYSILLGDGAGNFTASNGPAIANQTGPNYVTVGDYNADGNKDLIVSRFFQTNLLVLLGNGNGTFTASPTQIGVPPNTTTLKSFDFNNDAKLDLAIITGENPSTLRIAFGNGNGTFTAPTAYPLTIAASADMAIEDFDLDGLKDILIGNVTDGAIILFKGNGSGVFTQQSPQIVTSPSPYALASKDFNGDGKPDIATASHVFAGIKIFLNDTADSNGLTVNDVSVSEGNSGNVNAQFNVSLAAASAQTVTVNYRIIKRTAEADVDYTPINGQLIFSPGTLNQPVNVQVKGDVLDENDETFVFSLNTPVNAIINDGVGIGTILDDDDGPTFFTPSLTTPEGNVGTVQLLMPATLSVASGKKVKVSYATSDGSAIAPGDYTAASGILYYAPGETSKNIKLTIKSETLFEYDEIFDVNFTNPVGTTPTNNPSTVVIVNDDLPKNTSDFDGDGKADLAIFRPSVGEWWYLRSSDGQNYAAQFGASTDKITPGDFTGDGKSDIAFWRPSTGEWFVLRSEDASYYSYPFGTNGDIPAVGDFDADGKADTAVFRPSSATWFIRRSSDGGATIQQFGQTGDVPVVADYDGDGRADIAIYRPSLGEWWIQRSTAGTIALQFGNSADKPVQADYTGDRKADVAFWRPSTGEWFVLRSENFSYYSFPFGISTDKPAPGDYDGDGKTDAAVFRPSDTNWYVQRSSAGTLIQAFGQTGDVPVPSAFIP